MNPISASLSFTGQGLVAGESSGPLSVLPPLSFWGGYDAQRGLIIDRTHAGFGKSLKGRTLVMPRARGSSSSSSVLAEALRNGTGPCGIILAERDLILAIGAITANELYALRVPVVSVNEAVFAQIAALDESRDVTVEIAAHDPTLPARIVVADAINASPRPLRPT